VNGRSALATLLLSSATLLTACTAEPATEAASPSAESAASASATGTPAPTPDPGADCASAAAADHYVFVRSVDAEGAAVTVTGTPAELVCGGADNQHFDEGSGTTRFALTSDATVTVWASTSDGPEQQSLPPGELAAYVAAAPAAPVFRAVGPDDAVTELDEQYAP
jgi:hypothetical protein